MSRTFTQDEYLYRICENVADIAYIAGGLKYYSGDSRRDISNFIEWAKEFEEQFTEEREEDGQYMTDIEKWALEKIEQVKSE